MGGSDGGDGSGLGEGGRYTEQLGSGFTVFGDRSSAHPTAVFEFPFPCHVLVWETGVSVSLLAVPSWFFLKFGLEIGVHLMLCEAFIVCEF